MDFSVGLVVCQNLVKGDGQMYSLQGFLVVVRLGILILATLKLME